MQKTAYLIGLKPEEFWSLTLLEFNLMVEAYNHREEWEWRKLAQLASWTMQPHVKKKITADLLLGKKASHKSNVISLTEKREYFEEHHQKFPKTL